MGYFTELINTLEHIGDVLPRYSTYAKLLQFHAPLQQALHGAYVQMLLFFIDAKTFLAKSSLSLIIGSLLRPFESDFEDYLNQMRRFRELIDAESHTASMILQVKETEKAAEERQRAEENRRRVEKLEAETEMRRKGGLVTAHKLWIENVN